MSLILFPWPLVEFVHGAADLVDNLFSLLSYLGSFLKRQPEQIILLTDKQPNSVIPQCLQIEILSWALAMRNVQCVLLHAVNWDVLILVWTLSYAVCHLYRAVNILGQFYFYL